MSDDTFFGKFWSHELPIVSAKTIFSYLRIRIRLSKATNMCYHIAKNRNSRYNNKPFNKFCKSFRCKSFSLFESHVSPCMSGRVGDPPVAGWLAGLLNGGWRHTSKLSHIKNCLQVIIWLCLELARTLDRACVRACMCVKLTCVLIPSTKKK